MEGIGNIPFSGYEVKMSMLPLMPIKKQYPVG